LLRDHGYTVERGELYYAETRQRVPVEITPELRCPVSEIT
jgi:CRISPR/Cas system-associated exonuclease Cas4 (RecB family)